MKLLPLFKPNSVLNLDAFEDPVTKELITADDVNLFLLSIDRKQMNERLRETSEKLPDIPFFPASKIKNKMEVFMAGFIQ